MKIRLGHVSNSSSSSFIVKFKSNVVEDDIMRYINLSKSWGGDSNIEFKDGEYMLYTSTSMFNDWSDIAEWPFIRAISEKKIDGVTLSNIIQTEDEYVDCNYEISFNSECWEMENYNYGLSVDDVTEDDKVEAEGAQNKIDIDYLKFLHDIEVIDGEDINKYAKLKLIEDKLPHRM